MNKKIIIGMSIIAIGLATNVVNAKNNVVRKYSKANMCNEYCTVKTGCFHDNMYYNKDTLKMLFEDDKISKEDYDARISVINENRNNRFYSHSKNHHNHSNRHGNSDNKICNY